MLFTFSVGKVCDFHEDCETAGDLSDEENCPYFYTFNECKSLADCFWMEAVQDDLDWIIGTVNDAGESGPHVNFQDSTEGKFLLVQPNGGDIVTAGTAKVLQTSFYQNSGAQCTVKFYVYILGDKEINLFPQLYVIEGESGINLVTLDRLDQDTIEEGKWTKVEIGIGRQKDQFNVGFVLTYSDDLTPYNAGIALDDITFSDCELPEAAESCEEHQFQCKETKACVSAEKTCDLTDDCGDRSDEDSVDCDLFTRIDFEDPDKPFGFFTQNSPGAEFKWKSGSNVDQTAGVEGTGPAFDHTKFNGHYIYIDSGEQTAMDAAYLVSPVIKADPLFADGCTVRVFYHMHGRSVGNLTFYKE